MTKKQKQEHLASLKMIAISNDFNLDSWGNYKRDDLRLKFKKNNIRIERKRGSGWYCITSKTIVKLTQEDFEKQLIFLKRSNF